MGKWILVVAATLLVNGAAWAADEGGKPQAACDKQYQQCVKQCDKKKTLWFFKGDAYDSCAEKCDARKTSCESTGMGQPGEGGARGESMQEMHGQQGGEHGGKGEAHGMQGDEHGMDEEHGDRMHGDHEDDDAGEADQPPTHGGMRTGDEHGKSMSHGKGHKDKGDAERDDSGDDADQDDD